MSWLQTVAILVTIVVSIWAIVRQLGRGVYELGRFVNRVEHLERTTDALLNEMKLVRQHVTPRKGE